MKRYRVLTGLAAVLLAAVVSMPQTLWAEETSPDAVETAETTEDKEKEEKKIREWFGSQLNERERVY